MRVWLIPPEAYLLGSIPFGYLLYRARTGGDIRGQGSGNIGATNVLRSAGKGLGILTLILDAAKGFAALSLAFLLAFRSIAQPYAFSQTGANLPAYRYDWVALALILAMAGHIFTPWLRFRGGKGVATALGLFLALAPAAAAWAVAIFVGVLILTRYVSLASLAASAAFPFLLWRLDLGGYPGVIYVAVIAAVALIWARHAGNIRRLWRGQERRLGRPAPTQPGMPALP